MPSKKLKPNQPCHCGSGKKYKKCCMVAGGVVALEKELGRASVGGGHKKEKVRGPPLRFEVGDRVLANVDHAWLPGTIVDTHYREAGWIEGRVSPYQIRLEGGGRAIHAPYDGDTCVRVYDEELDESPGAGRRKRGGKKQLRERSRRADASRGRAKERKKGTLVPERGNEETSAEVFARSGMLDASMLRDEYAMKLSAAAGWENLRVPPDVDEESLVDLLSCLFGCLRNSSGEGLELDEDDVDLFSGPNSAEILPTLLRMCIHPDQFGEEGEPSHFLCDIITLLESLQSQSDFRINGPVARQLCSLVRICTAEGGADFFGWETVCPLFNKADESAFLVTVEEMKQPYPCRGNIAELARNTMDDSWVEFQTHVKLFCEAISELLLDKMTSPDTRAELFAIVDSLLRNPDWSERVLGITLDSLRNCTIHFNINQDHRDETFDTLLKTASQTIAAVRGESDDLFLLKEIFSKDTRGIQQCYCNRHSTVIPKIVCDTEQKSEAQKSMDALVNRALASLENGKYNDTLEYTATAIKKNEAESWAGRATLSHFDISKKLYALRGQAQVEVGNFEDALYCLCKALGGNPTEDVENFHRRSPNKMHCDTSFNAIRALLSMGCVDEARRWYSCLMDIKASDGSDPSFTSEYVSNAQAKASVLISSATAEPTVSAPLIDGESAPEGLSCDVRECTWRSVGDVTEGDSVNIGTYTVPRLCISLVWVRGQLLIWNYRETKIVQWIQRPGPEVCYQGLFHTSGTSSIFVLTGRKGFPFVILLDNLHRLKQGGTCDAEEAMLKTVGINAGKATIGNETFEQWYDHLFALMKTYGKISRFAASQVIRTKKWNLAMIHHSANSEIQLFAGSDAIATNTETGPFALLTSKASFVLSTKGNSHTKCIYDLMFVEDGCAQTLVSSGGDMCIKIWDILSRSCKHTIRGGFSNIIWTLTCSSTLLFGATIRNHSKKEDAENSTFGSHCINVWGVGSGKHLATFRSRLGRTVEDLITIPERDILVSAHQTGEVHLWNYDRMEHIMGFKAIPSEYAMGISLHRHQVDYTVAMSITHLVMFSDPTQRTVGTKAKLPPIGQSLNCGHCGLWRMDSSLLCSRCKKVRFCDRECLTAAWPKHKKLCSKCKTTRLLATP